MTSEEKAFQDALDKDPTDQITRAVFADWLDEQGDPRGPGYREMARLRLVPWFEPSQWPFRYSGPLVAGCPGCWSFWTLSKRAAESEPNLGSCRVTRRWLGRVPRVHRYVSPCGRGTSSEDFWTRREAEDALALAWAPGTK